MQSVKLAIGLIFVGSLVGCDVRYEAQPVSQGTALKPTPPSQVSTVATATSESVSEDGVIFLDQGWTADDRNWYYDTSQGSQLVDYKWILALEQPDNENAFLADEHVETLRFIPRGFDWADPDRAEHLPVGFVKDSGSNWFGFSCSACHTNQWEYEGKAIRVDGGGTLADTVGLLHALTASVKQTAEDSDKFNRFANRVLGEGHSEEAGVQLAERLSAYLAIREDYDRRNASPIVTGYSRLDAFGRIYNKTLAEVDAGPDNFNPPDGPVSYPFLWGTDQSDYVQWVGNAPNSNIGSLARNVGEVLGVFAHVQVAHRHWYTVGYPSSAQFDNLMQLEQVLRKLQSPEWPDALPTIDEDKAGKGGVLFAEHCAQCHNLVDRTDVNRKVVAWMERLETIGTDPKTAHNAVTRTGKTGVLEGRKKDLIAGDKFGAEAPVVEILANEAVGMIIRHLGADIHDEIISLREGRGGKSPPKQGNFDPEQPLLAYKGRSLCGVWATAPYLHNGSVPSLWQLLTKPEDRVKTFKVGSRAFDPKEVGLVYQGDIEFGTEFDTSLPGNSNAGHTYGTDLTDDEKWALVEFMKTAMAPLPE